MQLNLLGERVTGGYVGSKEVWNFVYGCEKSGPSCLNCFAIRSTNDHIRNAAELVEYRGGRMEWTGIVRVNEKRLDIPRRWREPRLVFINDIGDTFHPDVSDAVIHHVCDVIEACPQHTFRFCTKRPERMRTFLAGRYPDGTPYNIWPGVTVGCNRDLAYARELTRIKVNGYRWLSAEPLHEHVVLPGEVLDGISFVVLGGESGPGARRMHFDWARSIRDQVKAPGRNIAFHYKQAGMFNDAGTWMGSKTFPGFDLLDGRHWHEFPDGNLWLEKWESA